MLFFFLDQENKVPLILSMWKILDNFVLGLKNLWSYMYNL